MRSMVRAACVAVALAFAVPAIPVLAQAPPAQASWSVIALKTVPFKVKSAQQRAFPHTKITKVEQSGTGTAAFYRLTLTGKHKEATFTAAGKLLK